jgi:rhodanese-related sulfurtransferase
VTGATKILARALILTGLSIAVAVLAHFSLFRGLIRGGFRESLVAEDRHVQVRLVGLREAEDLYGSSGAVFIDARTADEFKAGHIPGARSLPVESARAGLPEAILALPRAGTLCVYCEGGDCLSSLALAEVLSRAGFTDVRVMTGGWAEWRRAGLPEVVGHD